MGELDPDQRRLLAMFDGLRPASRHHLLQALSAREVDGVGGTLVVKVPRKENDLVDVAFVGGDARLVLEM